jgi:hypothetical protein
VPLVGGGAACLRTGGGEVEISVPRLFGKQKMRIPSSEVTFVDLLGANDDPDGSSPELTENTRVAILTFPSLQQSFKAQPNFMLLFKEPLQLPRVTWLGRITSRGLSLHARRGRLQRNVDGFFIQVPDPERAAAILSDVGATKTSAPVAWLLEHRQDRLSWPINPLKKPSEYLRPMGWVWLAMFPCLLATIGLLFSPIGHYRYLAFASMAGLFVFRYCWDRLGDQYRQAIRRQRGIAKSGQGLISEALRAAFGR